MSTNNRIRNFCIIAHIDHGKSTLADRFLELTGTVSKRDMKSQLLDSMDLERERGITIKLTPVRMLFQRHYEPRVAGPSNPLAQEVPKQGDRDASLRFARDDAFILNLIDTPGHVDFNYEVSRSLAAVEGAILLVDATQGVQAQTIGNLYLALEQNLTIIPVVNKIDMAIANVAKTKAEIMHLIGCKEEDILLASGRTGQGVAEILKTVVERIPPPPAGGANAPRALIFDSQFNEYKGVVTSVRVVDGDLKKGDKIYLMSTQAEAEVLELGYYTPKFTPADKLENGEIGYIVTGLKQVRDCRVGDTITTLQATQRTANLPVSPSLVRRGDAVSPPARGGAAAAVGGGGSVVTPLPGYKEVKPMVFAGIFPKEGDNYQELRDGIDKLKLSDSALIYEPEHSSALGFGFRCGFLGMLHLDIFQERVKREHGVEIIITVPSVAYKVEMTGGADRVETRLIASLQQSTDQMKIIHSPQEMPDPNHIKQVYEPWMTLDIITPKDYVGNVMALINERKGRYITTEYLSTGTDQRALLHYEIPLASLVTDFYDKLKTVTSGYASMNYEYKDDEPTDVVKLDILVADDPVESLATLVWRDEAYKTGKRVVESLKDSLPKQQFELKIQAAVGGKIIAAERLSALRKDVLAKMSGGDVTRKMKLLKKQKKGKERMKSHGKVDIPTEAYLAVLKR